MKNKIISLITSLVTMATTILFEYIVFFTVAGIATQQRSSFDEVP